MKYCFSRAQRPDEIAMDLVRALYIDFFIYVWYNGYKIIRNCRADGERSVDGREFADRGVYCSGGLLIRSGRRQWR